MFVGGWTLDAIEDVVAGDDIDSGEVLDLLAQLVDKSLVVVGSNAGGRLRYRLLEPVRQFAAEMLASRPDDHRTAQRRHADWFVTMAEAGEVDVLRVDTEQLFRRCRTRSHHHHLVCRNCGHAVEVVGSAVEQWARATAEEHGFREIDHEFEIFGLCADC